MAAKLFAKFFLSPVELLKSFISTIRGFFFSLYYPTFMDLFYTDKVFKFKKSVYSDIETIIPPSGRKLKVLEIGCGPGGNFEFLPENCSYTAVDKNAHFESVLLHTLKKYPRIELERFVAAGGEDMKSIFSNSIDVVVTSCIHCSVDDNKRVLSEIKRVLVPGGRYYFFEHCLDEAHTWRYKWQVFFNSTGLWQIAGNGCTFVNVEKILSEANFKKCNGKYYVCENKHWSYYMIYLIASAFGGYAEKDKL